MNAAAKVQFDQLLVRELSSVVGEDYVVDDLTRLEPYTHDNSPFPAVSACLVVKPSSAEQLSSIMKLANTHKLKIIARGAGLSLTGIASADPERTVIIDTTRLNKILEIDEENMIVKVECGIILGEIERELRKKELYVHTVTVPVNYVTLGGVLSGVVGGGLPPRRPVYGTGVNFVLGLKVVLPDGKILCTGAGGSNIHQKLDYLKGGNGPDVLGLFIGDGGIFGVKVEATLQMFPEPALKQGECRIFKNFTDAWKAFSKLMMLETFPFTQLRLVDRGADFSMEYVVETSVPELFEASLDTISKICKESGGAEGSEEEKENARKLPEISSLRSEEFVKLPRYFVSFMTERKNFPFIYREVKNLILNEISSKRLDKLGAATQMAFQPTLRNSMFCTFNIQYDPHSEESRAGILALGNKAYEKVIELGGLPQPHQGFGADQMSMHWSKEYREVMYEIKKTLDPNMVLNSSLWNLSNYSTM